MFNALAVTKEFRFHKFPIDRHQKFCQAENALEKPCKVCRHVN